LYVWAISLSLSAFKTTCNFSKITPLFLQHLEFLD
jgi:hypothetical protein